jgi:3-oxoadipate enol-lactonase
LLVEQVTDADPKGYRASMLALWSFNVLKRLGSLNLPTLVITGDSDTTVPFKAQKVLAEGILAASHVIIPDAGHAVSVEKPLEFNQILMQFLE